MAIGATDPRLLFYLGAEALLHDACGAPRGLSGAKRKGGLLCEASIVTTASELQRAILRARLTCRDAGSFLQKLICRLRGAVSRGIVEAAVEDMKMLAARQRNAPEFPVHLVSEQEEAACRCVEERRTRQRGRNAGQCDKMQDAVPLADSVAVEVGGNSHEPRLPPLDRRFAVHALSGDMRTMVDGATSCALGVDLIACVVVAQCSRARNASKRRCGDEANASNRRRSIRHSWNNPLHWCGEITVQPVDAYSLPTDPILLFEEIIRKATERSTTIEQREAVKLHKWPTSHNMCTACEVWKHHHHAIDRECEVTAAETTRTDPRRAPPAVCACGAPRPPLAFGMLTGSATIIGGLKRLDQGTSVQTIEVTSLLHFEARIRLRRGIDQHGRRHEYFGQLGTPHWHWHSLADAQIAATLALEQLSSADVTNEDRPRHSGSRELHQLQVAHPHVNNGLTYDRTVRTYLANCASICEKLVASCSDLMITVQHSVTCPVESMEKILGDSAAPQLKKHRIVCQMPLSSLDAESDAESGDAHAEQGEESDSDTDGGSCESEPTGGSTRPRRRDQKPVARIYVIKAAYV